MIVLRALAGLHDLAVLLEALRLGRFQFADLAADWLTEGRFTRDRDRLAELEARTAACPTCRGPRTVRFSPLIAAPPEPGRSENR